MKLFILYAIALDGTRDFLWAKMLPANFDWNAWVESRRDAMRILSVQRFVVEEVRT